MGATGLAFESSWCASTGYVLARDAWGQGLATEALAAMVDLAAKTGVIRLYALCHVDHAASRRVLEKGGFECEGRLRRQTMFPNMGVLGPQDAHCYSRILCLTAPSHCTEKRSAASTAPSSDDRSSTRHWPVRPASMVWRL